MKTFPLAVAVLVLSGADPLGPRSATAQTPAPSTYDRGQDISPTYDGWEQNADGTYSLYFGYFNRNADEEIDVPIGPNNTFDGGTADRGQPTHFYPNRKWWVFMVVVPANWPKEQRVTWTLITHGKTNQAKGWLPVSYTHLRAHETPEHLVCRLLLEKKKKN